MRSSSSGLHANTRHAYGHQLIKTLFMSKWCSFRVMMILKSDQWRRNYKIFLMDKKKKLNQKVFLLFCLALKSVAMLLHKEIPAFSNMHCYSFKPASAGLLFLSISSSPRDAFLCRLSLFFLCRRSEARSQISSSVSRRQPSIPGPLLLAPVLPSNPISTAA